MSGSEVLIVLILISAGFIRGAFGFGDALLAMPLLAMLLPLTAATPLMAFTALIIAAVILATEWRAVDLRAASVLIIAGMAGVPIGIRLITVVDAAIVKTCLGLLLIGFSLWSLVRPNPAALVHDRLAPFFGFTAGILGGAYNTSGPALVIYAALRKWEPSKFRAMMQAYCLVGCVWIIAMHTWSGNVTATTVRLTACAAPFIVFSTLAGQRLTSKLGTERFVKMVYVVLILLGMGLIASGLLVDSQPESAQQSAAAGIRAGVPFRV